MNFKEFLAHLGSATVKTLTDAKALLADALTQFTAAVSKIGELETKLSESDGELTKAKADLVESEGKRTAADGELASLKTATIGALAGAGIRVENLETKTIQTAATVRIESEAQTLLAARGIKPLPEKLKDGTPIDAKLETDEQIATAYMALPHGTPESVAFLEKHKDAIWRAHTRR